MSIPDYSEKKENDYDMKKYFGLLVGGLAMMLFASSASAAFIECSAVGSVAGNTQFTPTTRTLVCSGFSIPVGNTLNSINIGFTNDATSPVDISSGVTWTWTYVSGLTGAAGFTGTDGVNAQQNVLGLTFQPCAEGTGQLNCQVPTGPLTGWTMTGQLVNPITFSVSSSPSVGTDVLGVSHDGTGVDAVGQSNAHLFIQFNETAPAPEPATLVMAGGSLIGLALLARKRRKA